MFGGDPCHRFEKDLRELVEDVAHPRRLLRRRTALAATSHISAPTISPNSVYSLDRYVSSDYHRAVRARELLRRLKDLGCVEVRQKGSHVIVRCGDCTSVVAVHAGEDIKAGTLRAIERQLERCLGKGWLRE